VVQEVTGDTLAHGALYLVAGVILVAAGTKLFTPASDSQKALLSSAGCSDTLASIAVRCLPFIELALSFSMFLAWNAEAALLFSTAILTAFNVVLTIALRNGYRGTCACFGRHSKRYIGSSDMAFNGLLIILALFAALTPVQEFRPFWELRRADLLSIALVSVPILLIRWALTQSDLVWQLLDRTSAE
jgi:hypothetical protein